MRLVLRFRVCEPKAFLGCREIYGDTMPDCLGEFREISVSHDRENTLRWLGLPSFEDTVVAMKSPRSRRQDGAFDKSKQA